MQVTDNKEQILLGVQRLRTMASSCNPPPISLSLAMELSMSLPITPSDLASTCGLITPIRAAPFEASSCSATMSPPVQLEFLPLRPTSHRAASPQAPSIYRYGGCGGQQTPRAGIDVNQMPSSPESEDEEDDVGGAADLPMLQLSDPVRNSGAAAAAAAAAAGMLKREREKGSCEADQERMCEVSSRASDEEEGAGTRKKLRLSKEQSALLEESFKEHSTLNPKQKNALAKQLNLRPRQVEVWFQNRRARTKLKQTEVDCEFLKRCCERLTDENQRLLKEVRELRAIKMAPQTCVIAPDFYMPLPAATLTMCPSCERIASTSSTGAGTGAASLDVKHSHSHSHGRPLFSNKVPQLSPPAPFQQPSAAC